MTTYGKISKVNRELHCNKCNKQSEIEYDYYDGDALLKCQHIEPNPTHNNHKKKFDFRRFLL